MTAKKGKRTKTAPEPDQNQIAHRVMQEVIRRSENPYPNAPEEPTAAPSALSAYFAAMGRKGGASRGKSLTASRRKAIAKKAAKARWRKS